MNQQDFQVLLEQILHAIEHDDMVLPTLPEVAVKLQQLLDDHNVSADQIVTTLAVDPFVSAQIIKSANSAIFAGKPPVENVRDAVSRLGYRQLRTLVITITMNKMFYSNNPVINFRMKQVWEHSREVAAISYVLALRNAHLSPDQAMLAGLVHDIGVLPLCLHIEKHHVPIADDTLSMLIRKTHFQVGSKLLEKWNFPQDIVAVVAEHENIHRESATMPLADYVDIVTFANLQDRVRAKVTAWNNIAAVSRLGLSEAECQNFLEDYAERIELVEGLLGMTPRAKPQPQNNGAANTPPRNTPPASAPRNDKGGLLASLTRFWK